MPLEMRKTSQWWYGRYNVDGKVHVVNLKIRIEGERPDSITQDGDKTFERSKGKALEKFETLVEDAKSKKMSAEYVQKLHEIRTGRRIDSMPLEKFAEEWDTAPRKRKGSKRYVKQAHALFGRFVAFVRKHEDFKAAETLADVTPEMAEAFMQGERARGVSGRTYNAALILLRSAFKALTQKANIARNPFVGIPTLYEDTTHRKPFNQKELEAILNAVEADPFIRPVIVTGICTAMRRGDCCLLRWVNVDVDAGFVRVKTAKTGETVEIPMLPILRAEIAKHEGNGSEFVFPEQARMFQKNAQGITYRVKNLLEQAGFYDVDEEEESGEKKEPKPKAVEVDTRPLLPAAALLEQGMKVIAEVPEDRSPRKRERMTEVFQAYVAGTGLREIAQRMGISKSSVSLYLHEIEKGAGVRVFRPGHAATRPAKCLGAASAERNGGLRRASVRDFHSFRVTWITLALAAGVPMELVTRVTGHKTVDVVLKHYFRPGREDFRRTIEGAMPAFMTASEAAVPKALPAATVIHDAGVEYGEAEGPGETLGKALKALEGMTAKTWKAQRDVVAALVKQAKDWVDTRVVREVPLTA